MLNLQKVSRSFTALERKIAQVFQDNNSVLGECAQINTRRIYI